MLNRRIVLCGALAALTAACSQSGPSATASGTWRGRWIVVYGPPGVFLNSGQEQAEVEVGEHRILIQERTITLNGMVRQVPPFRGVVIDARAANVTVTVDGTPLFA